MKNKKNMSRRTGPLSDAPVYRPRVNEFNTISCSLPNPNKIWTTRVMTTSSTAVTASASSIISLAFTPSLSDLDETSAYTGLFDQYRIDAVSYRIVPMQNAIGLMVNATTITVPMYVVIDYDDSSVIATAAAARAFDTCVLLPPGKECVRTFQPRQAVGTYNGTNFTNSANEGGLWNDSASPNTLHFGLKILVPQVNVGQTSFQSWTIERDYYISFRKVHG